jgi:hypothetical protein
VRAEAELSEDDVSDDEDMGDGGAAVEGTYAAAVRSQLGPTAASKDAAARRTRARRLQSQLVDIVGENVVLRTPEKPARSARHKAVLKAEEDAKFLDEMVLAFVKLHDNTDGFSAKLLDTLLAKHEAIFLGRLDVVAAGAGDHGDPTDAVYLRVARHVVNKVLKSFQEQWAPMRCMALKSILHLSRVRYQTLMNLLNKTWEDGEEGEAGRWVGFKIYSGLAMPKLASMRCVRELEKDIVNELGLTSGEGASESAVVEFKTLMIKVIKDKRVKGVEGWGGRNVQLSVELDMLMEGDAAKLFRGVSATRVAFRLRLQGGVFGNSPFQVFTFLVVEGPDKYENVKDVMRGPLKDARQILEDGIEVDGTHYTFRRMKARSGQTVARRAPFMRCSLHSLLAQLPPSLSGTLAFPQPPQCDGTFRAEGTSHR